MKISFLPYSKQRDKRVWILRFIQIRLHIMDSSLSHASCPRQGENGTESWTESRETHGPGSGRLNCGCPLRQILLIIHRLYPLHLSVWVTKHTVMIICFFPPFSLHPETPTDLAKLERKGLCTNMAGTEMAKKRRKNVVLWSRCFQMKYRGCTKLQETSTLCIREQQHLGSSTNAVRKIFHSRRRYTCGRFAFCFEFCLLLNNVTLVGDISKVSSSQNNHCCCFLWEVLPCGSAHFKLNHHQHTRPSNTHDSTYNW